MTTGPTTIARAATIQPGAASGYRRSISAGVVGRGEAAVLAELCAILGQPVPAGLPAEARLLPQRLRDDDRLARTVWSSAIYAALVAWAARYHAGERDAWEEMAVYAAGAGVGLPARPAGRHRHSRGMIETARWVEYRGRYGERFDDADDTCLRVTLAAQGLVSAECQPTDRPGLSAGNPVDPAGYLAGALRRDLTGGTQVVIGHTWRTAQEHYLELFETTGLEGEKLIAAAQARSGVTRVRRLVNRLPRDWPSATRRAAGLLFTGSPAAGAGLLVWWATTPADEVPGEVRRRWSGLLAVVDPDVGYRCAEEPAGGSVNTPGNGCRHQMETVAIAV